MVYSALNLGNIGCVIVLKHLRKENETLQLEFIIEMLQCSKLKGRDSAALGLLAQCITMHIETEDEANSVQLCHLRRIKYSRIMKCF